MTPRLGTVNTLVVLTGVHYDIGVRIYGQSLLWSIFVGQNSGPYIRSTLYLLSYLSKEIPCRTDAVVGEASFTFGGDRRVGPLARCARNKPEKLRN